MLMKMKWLMFACLDCRLIICFVNFPLVVEYHTNHALQQFVIRIKQFQNSEFGLAKCVAMV